MHKILAIDDKKDNLVTLAALLKNLMPRCEMITAQSGMEGIAKARAELPDVILLDVKMPDMDGFETCRRLKSDVSTKHIPVIMITAIRSDPQSRIKGLEIGADAFLSKPIDEAELVSQVKVALRIMKAEDALRAERNSLEKKVQERTATLRQSEEKYQKLVENISDVIFEIDSQGLVTYASPIVKDTLGYDQGDVIGKNFIDFVHPEDRGLLIERFLELSGGVEYPLNYRMMNKSGAIRWVRTKTRPIMEDGRFAGARGTLIDITDQTRIEEALRESEKLYHSLFENMSNGFAYCQMHFDDNDRPWDFTYLSVNSSFETLTGLRNVAGKKVSEVIPDIREADLELLEIYGRVSKTGKPERFEMFVDSLEMWFWISVYSPKRGYFAAVFDGINERKQAEEVLRSEREKLEMVTQNIGAGLALISKDYQTLWANKVLKQIFGDVEGKTCYLTYNQRTEICPGCGVREVFEKGSEKVVHEQVGNDIEGNTIWSEIIATPIKDKKGNIMAALELVTPITERKQAEEELRRTRDHLKSLISYANAPIIVWDASEKISRFNAAFEHLTGFAADEVVGRSLDILFPKTSKAESLDRIERASSGELWESVEIPILCKDGQTRLALWNSANVYAEDGKTMLATIAQGVDITERKRAEEVLRTERQRFQMLSEHAPFGMVMIDKDGTFTYINPKFKELFGYDLNDVPNGKTWFRKAYSDPINRHNVISDWVNDLKIFNPREKRPRVFTATCKDGSEKIIKFISVQLESGENLMTCEDITEHIRAEEALRESEERFKELYDNAPVGYHEYDAEGRITNVNGTDLEMLGYTREEMIGQPMWKFNVGEDIAREQILAKLAGTLPPGKELERRYRKKDGTTLPVLIENRVIRDEKGRIKGIRCTIQDISERKRAEEEMASLQEQLRQSQKMEAIGHLAGGIAHDFNNLLTIIKGYSQLSLIELKEGDPLKGNIEEIKRATDRASDLIRQLLAFSRRQVMEMRVLDLNILLQNLDKMLRRVIGEDIELVTLLAEDLGRVKTDPGQIEQVILNLAVNARDAMPSGGKLTIETANVELDGVYARRHVAVTPGRYVMLAVGDTGVGMTPEVRDRVFEPFFTTKEEGKGTGLGLSTVYGIVKQSEGNIWIYSEPGHGTTFKIYLPQVEELLEEVKEKVAGDELPRGSETVLVVEDEEEVRRLAVRILRGQGYKVLEASQGDDALRLCEEHNRPIQLMVTDVVMPGMDGRELTNRLMLLHPETKVLYMSGYTDNTIVHHGVLEEGINYIQKPFTVDALAGKVREVLDNKEG